MLTVTLGGHDLSISAFEYILEIENVFGEEATFVTLPSRMCLPTFMPADEFLFRSNWEGVILGYPFMRGLHSKWDFGDREIGCKRKLNWDA